MPDRDLTHVLFELEIDDGWPPVSGERVWAEQVGADLYQLMNAPWFARGVAEGDVVRAEAIAENEWPRFAEVTSPSGNCTIRVIPMRAGSLKGSQAAVLDMFTPLGATGESAGMYPIVALTIPPAAPVADIKELLVAGEADGRWSYEEGCITQAWRTA